MNKEVIYEGFVFEFELKSVSGQPLDNQTGAKFQVEKGNITLFMSELPKGATMRHAKRALFMLIITDSGDMIPMVQAPHRISEWVITRTDDYDDTDKRWKVSVSYQVVDETIRAPKTAQVID